MGRPPAGFRPSPSRQASHSNGRSPMKWALWGGVVVFLLLAAFCFNFYRVHLEDKAHSDESARFHLEQMKSAGPGERPRHSRAMESAIAGAEHYQQLSTT